MVVTAYQYEATTTRWLAPTVQLYDGATPLGSPQTLNLSATSTNSQAITFTGVASWANLANLTVVLSITKSGSTSSAFNVDAARVVVNYTPAGAGPTRTPARFSPLHYGPSWRRSFRQFLGPRYSGGSAPLPIFGTNQGTPWQLMNSGIGPIYGYRGYNVTEVPASWPGPHVNLQAIAQIPAAGTIISINPPVDQVLDGTLDAGLAAFFATVPAGAFISAWPEAEMPANQALGYSGTSAQIIAGHAYLYGLFGRRTRGRPRLTGRSCAR